ncbi:MAG: YdcF family protein [Proteobacteria bacterium]|nr:YdcF family protein [Pseudomonadota bacterium]
MTTKHIIIVLGHANDEEGNLSEVAKERLDKAFEVYEKMKGSKFILTGGFGERFNMTDAAHAHYARDYLVEKGVDDADILEYAESYHTIEDAKLSRPIVEKEGAKMVTVVTSDFHIKRTKAIFEYYFSGFTLAYAQAKRNVPPEKLEQMIRREDEKLLQLMEHGIIPYKRQRKEYVGEEE